MNALGSGLIIGGLLALASPLNVTLTAVQERGLTGSTKLDRQLPGKLAGYKFHVTEGIYAPGGYVGDHRHAAPGVRIVVQGFLTFQQGGKTTLYRQGDVYYETGKDIHSASNRTRKAVQVINVEVLPVTFNGPTLIRPDAGRGHLRREHRKNLRAAGGG